MYEIPDCDSSPCPVSLSCHRDWSGEKYPRRSSSGSITAGEEPSCPPKAPGKLLENEWLCHQFELTRNDSHHISLTVRSRIISQLRIATKRRPLTSLGIMAAAVSINASP